MSYPEDSTTREIVIQRINELDVIAADGLAQLTEMIQTLLSAMDVDIPFIDVDFNAYVPELTSFEADRPLDFTIDDLLASIGEEDIIDQIDTSDISVNPISILDFTGVMPTIITPAVPTGLDAVQPTSPALSDIQIPTKPSYVTPAVPSITEILVDDPPALTIPEFDGIMPDDSIIDTIVLQEFAYSEADFTSLLNDAVNTKLLNDVTNGGTGLGADIQEDIWNKQRERDAIADFEELENRISVWASRKYPLPDRTLLASIDEALEKTRMRLDDKSRDIAIEEAKLAQTNTHFAITSAIQYSSMLMNYASARCERLLRAAIATTELSIAYGNAKIASYQAKLEGYKAKGYIYEILIRGEMLKAEAYRNLIESGKLRVDIQRQYIEIYKAQLEGIETLVEVYKTEMEAARLQSEVDKVKIERFRAEVEAFAQLVQAKTAEYGLYKAKWEGEETKVKLYETQARAYSAYVEGRKATADVETARVNAEIAVRNHKINVANILLEQFKVNSQVVFEKVKSLIEKYKADTVVYTADISIGEAIARLDMERAKIAQEINNHKVSIKLAEAQSNLQAFVQISNAVMEAAKGGSSVLAALVSAAMQAIHTSAGISSDYNVGASTTVGYSYSGEVNADVTPKIDAP